MRKHVEELVATGVAAGRSVYVEGLSERAAVLPQGSWTVV